MNLWSNHLEAAANVAMTSKSDFVRLGSGTTLPGYRQIEVHK